MPAVFSGGSYAEVARWLANFLVSHAKRENLRAEVELQQGDDREGRSYGVRVRIGDVRSDVLEFDYQEVAANRGRLAWCRELAERARTLVRALGARPGVSGTASA